MEVFQLLGNGFITALSGYNLLVASIGAILGMFVGALPGIGSLAGVALLLPLTFKFEPTAGLIMLSAVYYSNMYGGSYSAILLNIPGDSPAITTALDGYPLMKQGKPGKALFTANIASFIGGSIGILILSFTGPTLARIGLSFGPIEMSSLLLLAMTSLSWLLGSNPLKGLLTTLLGMLIATIGYDVVSGAPRYDLGSLYLLSGIPFIPLVIGMFGFSQVLEMMLIKPSEDPQKRMNIKLSDSILTRKEISQIFPPSLRSGFIGTIIGILPGAGATTGSFLGYVLEKKIGRNRHKLGEGAIEGVAASEAANNAAAAGAFAPLLSLGIPGSGTGAVLLGGLLMYGLTPGPLLFQNEPEFTWGIIASLYLANLVTLLIGLLIIPFLTTIIKVPIKLIIPIIMIICIVGSFSASNSIYGVVLMIIFGFLGFLLKYHGYPVAPLLLAFVLSPTLEISIRRSLIISNGSLGVFFSTPISAILMTIFLLFLIIPCIKTLLMLKR